jgi:hypothetical protein
LTAAQYDLAHAEKHPAEIERKAQDASERKARKDAGGQRKRAKGDMPRILAGGRKDRSEDTSGKARDWSNGGARKPWKRRPAHGNGSRSYSRSRSNCR